jgi:hypothetical protein
MKKVIIMILLGILVLSNNVHAENITVMNTQNLSIMSVDKNMDYLTDMIDRINHFFMPGGVTSLIPNSEGIAKMIADSNNKLTADSFNEILTESNNVQNLEIKGLEKEIGMSKDRLVGTWNNVLSILFILLEILMVIFYLIQIVFILFLPFMFVKILTWVHGMVVKKRYNALLKKKKANYTIVVSRRMQ